MAGKSSKKKKVQATATGKTSTPKTAPATPTTPPAETLTPSDNFNSSFFVSITKTICFSYLLLALFLYIMQGKLIFIGAFLGGSDAVVPPSFQHTTIETLNRDGEIPFRVAMYTNPKAKGIALFFGGNGETMAALIYRCEQFSRYDLSVISVEYPGYGVSPGPSTVTTILNAAEHAAMFAEQIAKDKSIPMFIIGSSIGGFPAVHLTSLGYGKGTLLHAPLTSMVDVAARLYWYMPVRTLLDNNYRFDNVDKLKKIQEIHETEGEAPRVLILHGTRDEIVPYYVGQECAALLGDAGVFHSVEGASHNDVPMHFDGPLGEQLSEFFSK